MHLTGSGGSTETQAGMVLGSPAYMPPEVAEGRAANADERTDVYLLGATLYHVLTGKPPRQGSSRDEMIEMARTVAPPPPHRPGPTCQRPWMPSVSRPWPSARKAATPASAISSRT